MDVFVVGAGIGGLATALSLHQAGINVRIFEAVEQIEPVGHGINIQPSAVRELIELGLGADLAAVGLETKTMSFFNTHGQLIWSEPRGRRSGYRWPQYSISRGALQVLLLKAARERIGDENIVTGHRLSSFEQDASGVTARFVPRSTGEEVTHRADVLIGADGVHSAVRGFYYPSEGKPCFANQMMTWRGMVQAPPFLDGATQAIIGHKHFKVVTYPISSVTPDGGALLTTWFAGFTVPGEIPPRESWNRVAEKTVFAPRFSSWGFPWLDVPKLIDSTHVVYENPNVDRDPIPRWSFGRVTLLGDAAHAMQPVGSQAGTQAILDARHLTRALLLCDTPEEALRRYESERLPVTNRLVVENRRFGPEYAMQVAEERAPGGFSRIEDIISKSEMESFAQAYKLAAGFDRDTLNGNPSIIGEVLKPYEAAI